MVNGSPIGLLCAITRSGVTSSTTQHSVSRIRTSGSKTQSSNSRIKSNGSVKTNLITNPSFESDIVGNGSHPTSWNYVNTSGTPSYVGVANDFAAYGSKSYKISAATNVAQQIYFTFPNTIIGQTYTFSVYVKTDASVTNAAVVIYDNGNSSVTTVGANNNGRVSVTRTITGGGTISVALGLGVYGSSSSGTVWFDGAMLEMNDTASAYFDGDSLGGSWNGTAKYEYSTWVKQFAINSNGYVNNQENQSPLGTYVSTDLGSVYLSSLAAIWAINNNDIPTATRVLDAMQTFFNATFTGGPNGLYPAYTPSIGAVASTSDDRYIGNNAFLLLALNHYQAKVSNTQYSNRYLSMANSLAAWIAGLQDISTAKNRYNDGGFYAGYRGATSSFTPNSLMNYKVTEGHIDAVAALRGHTVYYGGNYNPNVTAGINYLFSNGESGTNSSGVYHPTYHRFYAGKTDSATYPSGSPTWDGTEYLDNVLWSILAIDDSTNYNTLVPSSITTTNGDMYISGVSPDWSPNLLLSGFTDVQGTNHIFSEGYAYFALVRAKQYATEVAANGYTSTAISYWNDRQDKLNAYYNLSIPSTQVDKVRGPVQKSNLPSYTGESTSIGTESTLWYLLAVNNINPFDASQGGLNGVAEASVSTMTGMYQPATSRIVNTSTKLQSSNARIRKDISYTQNANSRIVKTITKTQSSVSRILKVSTNTRTANSRILKNISSTNTSNARIVKVITKTQSSNSRLSKIVTFTASSNARIVKGITKTQLANLRISKIFSATQSSISRMIGTYSNVQPASAHIRGFGSNDQNGISRIRVVGGALGGGPIGILAAITTNRNYGVAGIGAKADIRKLTSFVQSASASINGVRSANQAADARVSLLGSKSQQSNARINNLQQKIQLSRSSIRRVTTKTQSASGFITSNWTPIGLLASLTRRPASILSKTQTAVSRIQVVGQFAQGTPVGFLMLFSSPTNITAYGAIQQLASAAISNHATRTQVTKARIVNVSSKTQIANGRIRRNLGRAQNAIARIGISKTLTQPAIGRLRKDTSKLQPANASIRKTVSSAQTSLARIIKTVSSVQLSNASIRKNVAAVQHANARILFVQSNTTTSTARISKQLNKAQNAVATIRTTTTHKDQTANSRIKIIGQTGTPVGILVGIVRDTLYGIIKQAASGSITIDRSKLLSANASIRNGKTITQVADSRIVETRSTTQQSNARVSKYITVEQSSNARIKDTLASTQQAIVRIEETIESIQVANARIESPQDNDQFADARISIDTSVYQTASAIIEKVFNSTITADSRIIVLFSSNTNANATIENSTSTNQAAKARVESIVAIDQVSNASIATVSYTTQPANGRITRSVIKIFDGSSFVSKPIMVWNGTTWEPKPIKTWDGNTWVHTI
jgi:hypothetical protein